MSADAREPAAESMAAKSAYVLAFLAAAGAAFVMSYPLRHWIIASYPNMTHWLLHGFVGLLLTTPIFLAEDRFLVRKTGRDVFSSVRPVTIGIIVGYAAPYAVVA
jgi:uncharacterized membrane protein